MAGSVNKVILVGNLGADPEIRRLNSGDPVVNMRVVAEQYLKKGMKVYLEGQLQTRKWQDQTGNDRYTTEIVLQKFRGELQMLDSRGQGEGGGQYNAPAARGSDFGASSPNESQGGGGGGGGGGGFSRDLDDEIPF